MLTKVQIAEKVWAIYSDTQEEIGKAFVRFQEYYENKELKGKTNLTVRDVEEWWAQERVSQETTKPYYQYWSGFNIPGSVILRLLTSSKFRVGFSYFPWWYQEEDEFLELLQDLSIEQINAGYFIGLSKTSDNVLDHEVAHALYATNLSYLRDQLDNIHSLPDGVATKLRGFIIDMGYHESVANDELQAYMSTYTDGVEETFGTDEFNQYIPMFEGTFKKYSKPECDHRWAVADDNINDVYCSICKQSSR